MIILHHLNNSRSQRILWLLEELQLDYRIERYQRDPVSQAAPESLKQVHPLGKSPVIVDQDLTLAESGAIIEYLAGKYGEQLIPAAEADRLQYLYWLHYAEGSLMPLLVMKLIFGMIAKAPMPFFIRPVAQGISKQVHKAYLDPNLHTQLAFVEAHLARSGWFAGEAFSAADIQMSFPLEAAGERQALTEAHPRIRDWLARIHARPAYQRALAAGGPYAYA